jgi:hypothetical protein
MFFPENDKRVLLTDSIQTVFVFLLELFFGTEVCAVEIEGVEVFFSAISFLAW